MVMVVFLHANNLNDYTYEGSAFFLSGYNKAFQIFIADGIARIAVPLFFLISGLLFFYKVDTFNRFVYFNKVKTRLRTLVVPYFLWSILGILFYFFLQSLPYSQAYFKTTLIKDFNLEDYIFRIGVIPIPYQFWFIKDLFLIVLISPILYGFTKLFKIHFLYFLIFLWFIHFDYQFFQGSSILFFSVGVYLAVYKPRFLSYHIRTNYILPLLILWLLMLGIKTYFVLINCPYAWLPAICHKLGILMGMLSLWLFIDKDRFRPAILSSLLYVSQFNFFLFASHEPLLSVFKKAGKALWGDTELMSFTSFLLMPSVVIIFCVQVGILLKKYGPRPYNLLTGGR